jgi:hypothetical protein
MLLESPVHQQPDIDILPFMVDDLLIGEAANDWTMPAPVKTTVLLLPFRSLPRERHAPVVSKFGVEWDIIGLERKEMITLFI